MRSRDRRLARHVDLRTLPFDCPQRRSCLCLGPRHRLMMSGVAAASDGLVRLLTPTDINSRASTELKLKL